MTDNVTEAQYPIQMRWIWKDGARFFIAVIISLLLLFFGLINYYLILLIFYTPFHVIYLILRRKNFHYMLAPDHMEFYQGILNKQHRTTQYGVIQNVFVHQDFFDRIFRLASLSIENAAEGGNNKPATFLGMPLTRQNTAQNNQGNLGFSGNNISIPGLNKADAEVLKQKVLDCIKANPIKDNTSGL